MKRLTQKATVLGVCSVLLLLFTACDNHDAKHEKGVFPITKPWRQDLTLKKRYVAKVHAIQHIELRAFEKGYLQKIFVDEGQMIEEGTEMFEIMPFIIQAEYKKALAEYQLVQLEYKNTKRLAEKNVVSKNELALVKAKLNKVNAELSISKTHLDFTHVKAPFSGIMDKFEVRLGSLVDEGELLTTLSDISKVWVYFNVSEVDYLNYMKLKKNKDKVTVWFEMANGELFPQSGILDTIEADFNSETGNIAFRATFENPELLLRHGQTGNIILTDEVKQALVIPQKSAFEILDQYFVYVVNGENKIESRQVTVGEEVPHLFAIKSGLKEDDRVLLEGHGKVKAGDTIDISLMDSKQVLAGLELPVN